MKSDLATISREARIFDLQERTKVFSSKVINWCKLFEKNVISQPLISQLIRSATSIGANYCEATEAESARDFYHKIAICRKEAKETEYWLDLLINLSINKPEDGIGLKKEVRELVCIFNSMSSRRKRKI